jgi:glycosyltransferase involved in cell wall biosynthesis
VGRCTDIKGVHLLVDAVMSLPVDTLIEVHFFGPYWDDEYGLLLKKKIGHDKRFISPRLVAPENVVDELKSMDICVIPSLWPETGPLSLFDAFAAGIPVLGTRHAGIQEKTREGFDSILFNWNDVDDLKAKILMLLNDRSMVEKMKSNIKPNRTFADFGRDMERLYQSVAIR